MKLTNKFRFGKVAALSVGLAAALFAGQSTEAHASGTATVIKGVNFRADDTTSSSVYGTIPTGTVLPVQSADTYWVKVAYNGRTGYVSRSYVTLQGTSTASAPAATTGTGSKIVSTAKTYQGKVTYVWGERDPSRLIFDCSSFTQFIYKKYGISLPWSSRQQSQMGSYVSKSNLRTGDLVFFSVGTPGQVGHVGIYIGSGQFIHNLPNKGVIISSLGSTYWSGHYITGRRVL